MRKLNIDRIIKMLVRFNLISGMRFILFLIFIDNVELTNLTKIININKTIQANNNQIALNHKTFNHVHNYHFNFNYNKKNLVYSSTDYNNIKNTNAQSGQQLYRSTTQVPHKIENFNEDNINFNETEIISEEEIEQYLYLTLLNLYASVKLWREFYIIFGTFITILGFILNSFCIFIFFKSKLFRNSSFPYYVYVIAIVDTLNIFFRFLVPQTLELYVRNKLATQYNISSDSINQHEYDAYTSQITSDYLCSVITYIQNSLTLVSVWLMVAVSVERWLVIKFALQTKYMIKLRAFIILLIIFVIVFSFNLFDLSPGLYIKPQWYSNLTLFCERHDIIITETNSSDIYKDLGPFKYNTRTFALVRTLFQSVIPFLVVLLFNSLIIYNFKKIKLAALGTGRGKSNSCVSVMSGGSQMMFSNSSNFNSKSRRHHRRYSPNDIKINTENLELSKDNNHRTPSSIIFTKNSNCSRSPSPLPIHSSTPTSLVSALNLADGQLINDLKATNPIKTEKKLINKNPSNKFLMPPSFSTSKQQQKQLEKNTMNDSTTPSIGSTNSSANLSMFTASNLTTTTILNPNNSKHLNPNQIHEKNRSKSITNCIESERFSMLITNLTPSKKTISTITTITNASSYNHTNLSNKLSFKSRRSSSSRFKLNRETDIMLIVLSFCILLSQLPFTIVWYLIYYYGILLNLESIYLYASVPKVFYLIRILEMIYFSSNFLFYITLSPSLRKEIQNYSFKTHFKYLIDKYNLRTNYKGKKTNDNLNNINTKILKNIDKTTNEIKKTSTSRQFNNEFSVNNLNTNNNDNQNRLKAKDTNNLKMLDSNASGDYYTDYLDKLRSVSPVRHQEQPHQQLYFERDKNEILINHNLNGKKIHFYNKNRFFNKNLIKKLVHIKKKKGCNKSKTSSSSSSIESNINTNNNVKRSNIKIIIDSLYDEKNEAVGEDKLSTSIESLQDKFDKCIKNGFRLSGSTINLDNSLNDDNKNNNNNNKTRLCSEKKLFNLSSPAFLTQDHIAYRTNI